MQTQAGQQRFQTWSLQVQTIPLQTIPLAHTCTQVTYLCHTGTAVPRLPNTHGQNGGTHLAITQTAALGTECTMCTRPRVHHQSTFWMAGDTTEPALQEAK